MTEDNVVSNEEHSNSTSSNVSAQNQPLPPPINVPLNEPLRVRVNTALYDYLNARSMLMIGGITCLGQILTAIKEKISRSRLFDEKNPVIVMCDQELENIVGMKALHVNQMREALLKSTVLAIQPPRNPSHPSQHQQEAEQASSTDENSRDNPANAEDNSDDSVDSVQDADVADNHAENAQNADNIAENAGNIAPNADNNTENNQETKYYVVSPLLRILLKLPMDPTPMTFQGVTSPLSKYILARQDRLFDKRNHMVAILKDDPLGKILGVKAVHRDQLGYFVKKQLTAIDNLAQFDARTADQAFPAQNQLIRDAVFRRNGECRLRQRLPSRGHELPFKKRCIAS
eukprot:TRINITY_DN5858_c0_g1_i4.p1 TRINITY_DN5858_c0_g1~~TRINITY_DN5858_c0_g1_i4.p1  ORF type:complete len:345 (-),score=88.83 TRINITY_DN5858_c0_g1_i4:399-1433(-)